MKIYVVTSGSYSDYMINAVFLDKDKAQKYADVLYDACVEEYDTKDENLEIMMADELYTGNRESIAIEVCIQGDGLSEVRFFRGSNIRNEYVNHYGYECFWYRKKIDYSLSEHDKIKERAIKAAYDLRAFARSLKVEGYTVNKINEMINNKED